MDIRWQEGRLREAVLHARKGGRVVIRCSENLKVSKEGEDVQVCRDKKGRYIWETCAGGIYRLDSCG